MGTAFEPFRVVLPHLPNMDVNVLYNLMQTGQVAGQIVKQVTVCAGVSDGTVSAVKVEWGGHREGVLSGSGLDAQYPINSRRKVPQSVALWAAASYTILH